MKTIFITSLNPFVTRNILFTDVFKKLTAEPNLQLVIFCPDYKKEYFEQNFQSNKVTIEAIKNEKVSKQDVIFSYLTRSINRTKTLAIHRREIFLRNKNIFAYLVSIFLSWIGWLPSVKKIIRFLDQLAISKNKFSEYFERYNPDVVFGPDVFHIDDLHFLAEAKHRGIKTVGMVRSWDNITNKGLFRIRPDSLIVNNEVILDEAMEYGDMKKENIFVAGMPQFDYYINEPRSSREDFFQRINFDSKKPLVLFSPWGSRFIDTDWKIMQILKEARIKGEISRDLQFLVRMPPNDNILMGDFIPDDHFRIERPSRQFHDGVYRDQELDREAMIHLADTLHYSDLVIAYTSSLNIDACAFDKPIIGIAFDGLTQNSYLKSAIRFLDWDHTNKMLFTNWAPFTCSKEELIKYVNLFLKDPSSRREERAHFLKLQTWKMDGKSGERIADFLISQLP